MKNVQTSNRKSSLDKIGFFLSLLCAVHCASMPLLVAILPLLGAGFLHNPLVDLILIGSTVLLAGAILIKDYRNLHRSFIPLLLLFIGIAVKLLGIFIFQHQYEPVIITSGVAFILLAYITNWRLRVTHRPACKC